MRYLPKCIDAWLPGRRLLFTAVAALVLSSCTTPLEQRRLEAKIKLDTLRFDTEARALHRQDHMDAIRHCARCDMCALQ